MISLQNLKNKRYWIWLSLIKKLGSKRKLRLLEKYKNPETIYKMTNEELLKIDGIGKETINNINNSKNEKLLDYHINYMIKNNIDIINIEDKEYPNILKKVYDPPISLYIK